MRNFHNNATQNMKIDNMVPHYSTLHLKTVSSGSSGNGYLIESNGRYLAIEAGVQWEKFQQMCDFQMSLKCDALLVSHCHLDHCKHVGKFAKNGIYPICVGKNAVESVENATSQKVYPLADLKWKAIGDWKVFPFQVHHDEVCYGYIIKTPSSESVLYATDFSYVGIDGHEYNFAPSNIDHFIVSVNYTDVPDEGASEHVLRGHSSLDTVVNFLKASMTESCKSVSICHVSERNADENLILDTIKKLAGDKVNVNICKKGEVINL